MTSRAQKTSARRKTAFKELKELGFAKVGSSYASLDRGDVVFTVSVYPIPPQHDDRATCADEVLIDVQSGIFSSEFMRRSRGIEDDSRFYSQIGFALKASPEAARSGFRVATAGGVPIAQESISEAI